MKEELKPCPFCGGEALLEESAHLEKRIRCSVCKCCTPWYILPDDYYTAWNTRPSPWIKITPETKIEANKDVFMDHEGLIDRGHVSGTGQWWLQGHKVRPPNHYMPIPPIPEEN